MGKLRCVCGAGACVVGRGEGREGWEVLANNPPAMWLLLWLQVFARGSPCCSSWPWVAAKRCSLACTRALR
eukprot:8269629-Alexandrium_andersonii.AAC.1